jgi:hypothetical protein
MRPNQRIRRSRRPPPKLVNYTVAHAPGEGIERAERAFAALSSERVPAAVASVAFDSYWAGLLLGRRPPGALRALART